jgi:GNAT superfamily N-acetyltransferase
MQRAAGRYVIDDDPARIDPGAAAAFLTTEAYWGRWRGEADVRRQIGAAWRVVGAYDQAGAMVGFARAFSDGGSVYLADMYVLPTHRGAGLGKAIVRAMIEDGPGAALRWMLHTSDAHGLYRSFGFAPPTERPSRYMERPPSPAVPEGPGGPGSPPEGGPRGHGGPGSPPEGGPGGHGGAGSPPVSRGGLGGIVPPASILPPRTHTHPGLAVAVPAEHDAGDNQHRPVRRRIKGKAAERYRPGPAHPDLVVHITGIKDRAEPFLSGREPVFAGGQRDPDRLTPADQPGTVMYPGEDVRLGELPEKIPGVRYCHSSDAEPPSLLAPQHLHTAGRVT